MASRRVGLWTAAAAVAGALSWAAYRGPPPRPAAPLPPSLPRPPTGAEWSAVQAQAQTMSQAIHAARTRSGALPTVAELEGLDPTGQRWLPDGIPDNPLVQGVGTVGAGCELDPDALAVPDWWYCEQTGRFRPGGDQSGKG